MAKLFAKKRKYKIDPGQVNRQVILYSLPLLLWHIAKNVKQGERFAKKRPLLLFIQLFQMRDSEITSSFSTRRLKEFLLFGITVSS